MNALAEIVREEAPTNLETMSSTELRSEFERWRLISAASVMVCVRILRVLRDRGEDVTDLASPKLQAWLLQAEDGTLLPDLISNHPDSRIIDVAATMPREAQQMIVDNVPIPVVDAKFPESEPKMMTPAKVLTTPAVRHAVGTTGFLSVDQQRQHLKRTVKHIIPDQLESVVFEDGQIKLRVGGSVHWLSRGDARSICVSIARVLLTTAEKDAFRKELQRLSR